jgi:hypothetical protein
MCVENVMFGEVTLFVLDNFLREVGYAVIERKTWHLSSDDTKYWFAR